MTLRLASNVSTGDPLVFVTRPPPHYGLAWQRRLVFGWREALCHARNARRFGWEHRVRGATVSDLLRFASRWGDTFDMRVDPPTVERNGVTYATRIASGGCVEVLRDGTWVPIGEVS